MRMNQSKQVQDSDTPQMNENTPVQRLNDQQEHRISKGNQGNIADEMPEKIDDHSEKQWCNLRRDESILDE
jgi:hypothetical protein